MNGKSQSAVVIGEESLLVHGAQAWLERGHTIALVLTDDREVAVWAERSGLRVASRDADVAALVRAGAVDWVLSLANDRGIPDEVRACASRGVVHYHDGPHPRFAGVYPTTWAILEGETRYGISWLLIDPDGVERILLSRSFDLSSDETALSLNTRCHAAAVESFGEVVEAIERGSRDGTPVEGERREYERTRRPWALGHLDFRRSARELAALVRGLDFGAYRNPLCVPKLIHEGRAIRVASAEVIDSVVGGEPGQVVATGEGFVDVVTGDGVLRLSRMSELDGRALEALPAVGTTLAWPTERESSALEVLGAELAASEPFFSRAFGEMMPVSLRAVGSASGREARRAFEVACGGSSSASAWCAALAYLVSRYASATRVSMAYADDGTAAFFERAPGLLAPRLPLSVDVTLESSFAALVDAVDTARGRLAEAKGYARELVLRETRVEVPEVIVGVSVGRKAAELSAPPIHLVITDDEVRLDVDITRVEERFARALAKRIAYVLAAAEAAPASSMSSHPLVFDEERAELVEMGAGPEVEIEPGTIADVFEAAVKRHPQRMALVTDTTRLTFEELDRLANGVAKRLVDEGLPRNSIVGLSVARGAWLVVGALGIMKAGHAYLPLDPSYPEARLLGMLEDSGAKVLLCDDVSKALAEKTGARAIHVKSIEPWGGAIEATRAPSDLAYVIYTSGSTGKPKGVMVEHRNVLNFFAGMDERVPRRPDGEDVWLAVTSLSFDISVLELFYTLARGFRVVLVSDEDRALMHRESGGGRVEFGLYYWGNDGGRGREKYRLLLEGAKIADRAGFNAVWTPERHFHAFGGPYPNPAVTGAAVAAVTQNVEVRAGSCVLPLHHPARVAEEWAVVDNLTQGRVGVAFASGWQPDDFVLRPENAPPRHRDAMLEGIEIVRKLWRGEAVAFPKGDGTTHEVVTMPRPMQAELPIWVTTAGNPQTWIDAANMGANVLTHLLGQTIAEVGEKVALYREALVAAGRDPRAYRVTLMLHTFVAETRDEARRIVEEPLKDYLRSAAGLIKNYAWSFPAFKRPEGVKDAASLDLSALEPEEMEGILDYAFHRYFDDSGLFGTVDDCLARVAEVEAIGVDEIACLVDFGIETDTVLRGIERLAEVVRMTKALRERADQDRGIAATIRRERATHLQCTPSMARMLLESLETRAALAEIDHLFLGGEALPGTLVSELRAVAPRASIENMYGPTETTIWSSTTSANEADEIVPIGRPIANTQLYVLDEHGHMVPPGIAGELYIGGAGVARGYLGRPELTAERFLPDPFRPGGRMYRTGDLVRSREDGTIDFLGRVDHQVKIRGHRIELGEIEAKMQEIKGIREAVLLAREDRPGDVRLVAYYTSDGIVTEGAIRAHLEASLPPYMLPSHFVAIERFPLTPNAKVDRKALPKPEDVARPTAEYEAPRSEIETAIVEVYAELFGRPKVGISDDFFALGGHSLLAVQAHRRLSERLAVHIGVTDIFRFPVVRDLAAHLSGSRDDASALSATKERAGARRRAMLRRRDGGRGSA